MHLIHKQAVRAGLADALADRVGPPPPEIRIQHVEEVHLAAPREFAGLRVRQEKVPVLVIDLAVLEDLRGGDEGIGVGGIEVKKAFQAGLESLEPGRLGPGPEFGPAQRPEGMALLNADESGG